MMEKLALKCLINILTLTLFHRRSSPRCVNKPVYLTAHGLLFVPGNCARLELAARALAYATRLWHRRTDASHVSWHIVLAFARSARSLNVLNLLL